MLKIIAVLLLAACSIASATYYRPRCPKVAVPKNGYQYGSVQHVYYKGSKVYFKCNPGYKLHGKSYAVCYGFFFRLKWTSSPSCVPAKCNSLGAPDNGAVKPTTSVYVGVSVHFSCKNGYKLQGSSSAKCLSTGLYDKPKPKCNRIYCINPGNPDDGKVFPSTKLIPIGKGIDFKCDDGFELDGERWLMCQSNGKFNHPTPTCEPKPKPGCKKPGVPLLGRITPYKTHYKHGESVHYSCKVGNLEGNSKRTCYAGSWSGTTPSCRRGHYYPDDPYRPHY